MPFKIVHFLSEMYEPLEARKFQKVMFILQNDSIKTVRIKQR